LSTTSRILVDQVEDLGGQLKSIDDWNVYINYNQSYINVAIAGFLEILFELFKRFKTVFGLNYQSRVQFQLFDKYGRHCEHSVFVIFY